MSITASLVRLTRLLILLVGTSSGALGRHTSLTPDGMPVFDRRMEVLFEVSLTS